MRPGFKVIESHDIDLMNRTNEQLEFTLWMTPDYKNFYVTTEDHTLGSFVITQVLEPQDCRRAFDHPFSYAHGTGQQRPSERWNFTGAPDKERP